MNQEIYYLIKPNGTLDGPYSIKELKDMIQGDNHAFSEQSLVINTKNGEQLSISKLLNSEMTEEKPLIPTTSEPLIVKYKLVFPNGEQAGEFTEQELQQMNNEGKIQAHFLVWTKGWSKWQTCVESFHWISQRSQIKPPPLPVPSFHEKAPVIYTGSASQNHITAGILAILLGAFGVHKFYNGSWGWGIIYITFFWTYIPGILGVIEGILYLVNQMKYDQKYNKTPPTPMKW